MSTDEPEHELVVVLDQTRRVHQVGAANRVENIGDGDAGGEKPGGIRSHLKLGYPPALDDDGGDTVEPVDARLQVVRRYFPQLVRGHGV